MAINKMSSVLVWDEETVKVTDMGFVTELLYMRNWNDGPRIQKLDKDHYICLDEFGNPVGQIKEFSHFENRASSVNSLRQTFRKLRNLINANVTDIDKVRFLTLTYRQENGEPMTDPERLYRDFQMFNQRFGRYCKRNNFSKYEYVNVVEPQGTGAWHCHVLFFFEEAAPYLDNTLIRDLWGQGFVTVRALKNQIGKDCTNVGAYLTAYLGDLDIQGAMDARMDITQFEVKEVEAPEEGSGKPEKKYYLKGARLYLYPPGMNIFRCSRGARRPVETYDTYKAANELVKHAALTYQTHLKIESDERCNLISKRYYNSAMEHSQDIICGYRVDTATGEVLENPGWTQNDGLIPVGTILDLKAGQTPELQDLDDSDDSQEWPLK